MNAQTLAQLRQPAKHATLTDAPRIVPARHPLRALGTVVAIIIILAIVQSVLGNSRWGWSVFAHWFFADQVLKGLGLTLLLTASGSVLGFTLGTCLALARVSGSPLL